MEIAAVQPQAVTDIVVKPKEKKNVSPITKIKKAIKRFGNTSFSKNITSFINSCVRSTWSLGKTAGRLCWVAGCYTVILLFPLAMEIDREQTLMEIQNREKERMTKRLRP